MGGRIHRIGASRGSVLRSARSQAADRQGDSIPEDVRELQPETNAVMLTRECRTPVERELLERMPPNTLEILAIQSCDDNALVNASISPSDDPDMVTIEMVMKPRALDSMGWIGFQSSQL